MASVFKRGGKNNRGGSYYLSWFDYTGKRRIKSARTTDKATAERIANKHEADAALGLAQRHIADHQRALGDPRARIDPRPHAAVGAQAGVEAGARFARALGIGCGWNS